MNKADCLLKWHGSKRALLPAIVKLFPPGYERMLYCEPFCGAAAVLYSKRPSHAEVLNDLDGDLLNFLSTVKSHPRELVRTLRLTPNSRSTFSAMIDREGCSHPCTFESSIQRAARFYYLSKTSFGGLREHWAAQGRSRDGGLPKSLTMPSRTSVYRWAERLSRATIECAPWQECVEKYDSPGTLFYFDPPYLGTAGYHSGSFGENDWRELRARLNAVKGKFVLSAEGSAVMKLLFRGLRQRLTSITSSLGPNNRVQKELLVWNY